MKGLVNFGGETERGSDGVFPCGLDVLYRVIDSLVSKFENLRVGLKGESPIHGNKKG